MQNSQVAEIVTFKLVPGATKEAFLQAMAEMQPFVDRHGGMVGRILSRDEDGLWTDHVLWETMEAAKTLAEAFMQAPETEAARNLIATESVTMRHAHVALQQG